MANTISDELNRLIQAKAGIKSALEEKGLTIGDSSTLDEFPGLIQEMQTGGSGGINVSTVRALIQGNITEFTIPEGTTQIRGYAFFNDTHLTDISIPNTVNNIYSCAFKNTKLQSINIPTSVRLLGAEVFRNTSIGTLYIPNSINQYQGNFNTAVNVFSDNKLLTSLTFQEPADFTEIPQGMCSGCSSLTDVNIPASITRIWANAFKDCSSLANIYIPSSVNSIGQYAFQNVSTNAEILLMPTTIPNISSNTFDGDYPIYVKNECINTYKNAGGSWAPVSTRINPLTNITYDYQNLTVQASGRDNIELYIDASLINSSVYTFTRGVTDTSHNIMVKSVDPSLGVLDTTTLEIMINSDSAISNKNYFCITPVDQTKDTEVTFNTYGNCVLPEWYYSYDKSNWNEPPVDGTYSSRLTYTIPAGNIMYLQGDAVDFSGSNTTNYGIFNFDSSVILSGNIASLNYGQSFDINDYDKTLSGCYKLLFSGNTSKRGTPNTIVSVENLILPATTFVSSGSSSTGISNTAPYAYTQMFEKQLITKTPQIAVTNLTTVSSTSGQASQMFSNCPLTDVSLGFNRIDYTGITWANVINLTLGENATPISVITNCTSLESLTLLADTPDESLSSQTLSDTCTVVYVPAASVTDYQTAWSTYADRIQAIPTNE